MAQRNDDGPYEPTILDVLVVRQMLNKALRLLPELIDDVFDWAEYWPHSTAIGNYEPGFKIVAGGGSRGAPETLFLIRSKPLGFSKYPAVTDPSIWTEAAPQQGHLRKEHTKEAFENVINTPFNLVKNPCRKIIFTLRSRDQGWGGDFQNKRTYKSSYTWFDAGLERFDAGEEDSPNSIPTLTDSGPRSVWPDAEIVKGNYDYKNEAANPTADHKVQSNPVASAEIKEHRVVWSYLDDIDPESPEADALEEAGRGKATGDGKFVRSLKVGDVVTLWAQARFPGWENRVKRVQVDVYWAV